MDYTIFIKKKFLNQSVASFATTFDKLDYKGFEDMVAKNTHFGMGKIAMKICRSEAKSIFDSVDGIELTNGESIFTRKDGYVDTDEMYQLIKNSYKKVNASDITAEELSSMTVRDAIELIIESNKTDK